MSKGYLASLYCEVSWNGTLKDNYDLYDLQMWCDENDEYLSVNSSF